MYKFLNQIIGKKTQPQEQPKEEEKFQSPEKKILSKTESKIKDSITKKLNENINKDQIERNKKVPSLQERGLKKKEHMAKLIQESNEKKKYEEDMKQQQLIEASKPSKNAESHSEFLKRNQSYAKQLDQKIKILKECANDSELKEVKNKPAISVKSKILTSEAKKRWKQKMQSSGQKSAPSSPTKLNTKKDNSYLTQSEGTKIETKKTNQNVTSIVKSQISKQKQIGFKSDDEKDKKDMTHEKPTLNQTKLVKNIADKLDNELDVYDEFFLDEDNNEFTFKKKKSDHESESKLKHINEDDNDQKVILPKKSNNKKFKQLIQSNSYNSKSPVKSKENEIVFEQNPQVFVKPQDQTPSKTELKSQFDNGDELTPEMTSETQLKLNLMNVDDHRFINQSMNLSESVTQANNDVEISALTVFSKNETNLNDSSDLNKIIVPVKKSKRRNSAPNVLEYNIQISKPHISHPVVDTDNKIVAPIVRSRRQSMGHVDIPTFQQDQIEDTNTKIFKIHNNKYLVKQFKDVFMKALNELVEKKIEANYDLSEEEILNFQNDINQMDYLQLLYKLKFILVIETNNKIANYLWEMIKQSQKFKEDCVESEMLMFNLLIIQQGFKSKSFDVTESSLMTLRTIENMSNQHFFDKLSENRKNNLHRKDDLYGHYSHKPMISANSVKINKTKSISSDRKDKKDIKDQKDFYKSNLEWSKTKEEKQRIYQEEKNRKYEEYIKENVQDRPKITPIRSLRRRASADQNMIALKIANHFANPIIPQQIKNQLLVRKGSHEISDLEKSQDKIVKDKNLTTKSQIKKILNEIIKDVPFISMNNKSTKKQKERQERYRNEQELKNQCQSKGQHLNTNTKHSANYKHELDYKKMREELNHLEKIFKLQKADQNNTKYKNTIKHIQTKQSEMGMVKMGTDGKLIYLNKFKEMKKDLDTSFRSSNLNNTINAFLDESNMDMDEQSKFADDSFLNNLFGPDGIDKTN